MEFIQEGIKFGLILTILVGPILIVLIQTSIEEGQQAAGMVGFGIWASDFIFITLVYSFFSIIQVVTSYIYFELIVGIIGGLILVFIGIGNLISYKKVDFHSGNLPSSSYFKLWMKGFAINTFNPFSIIFWLGISSNFLIKPEASLTNAILFFGSIMMVVIITDLMKIMLAKKIKKYLVPRKVKLIGMVSGVMFITFGIALIYQVIN